MSVLDDVCKYIEFVLGGENFFCDRNKKKGYRFYHSKLVANLCIYILENSLGCDIPEDNRKDMLLKKESICIAALLHDIKKNEKHHADKAADNLGDILKEISLYTGNTEILNIGADNIMIIEEMIRKHGSHGSSDELRQYYIKLIQDADNMSGYVSYLPDEVFNNIFDIRSEKAIYFSGKEKVKEKHKKLNYIISKRVLKII